MLKLQVTLLQRCNLWNALLSYSLLPTICTRQLKQWNRPASSKMCLLGPVVYLHISPPIDHLWRKAWMVWCHPHGSPAVPPCPLGSWIHLWKTARAPECYNKTLQHVCDLRCRASLILELQITALRCHRTFLKYEQICGYLVILDVSNNLLNYSWDTGHEGLHSLWIGFFQLGLNSGKENNVFCINHSGCAVHCLLVTTQTNLIPWIHSHHKSILSSSPDTI